MMKIRRLGRVAAVPTLVALLALPGMGAAQGEPPGEPEFEAEIRTTSYGVPHVLADDYAGAGYGVGYAFAEGHACTMAEHWVRLSADLSAEFGPDGGNLASDLFWQRLIDEDIVGQTIQSTDLAHGILPEVREMVRGYVAGYNRYLDEVGYEIPDRNCEDAKWVRPITERDVYHHYLYWDLQSFLTFEFGNIAAAAPPGTAGPSAASAALNPSDGEEPTDEPLASNMIGLGSDATASGNGMLFANPHWQWSGPVSFFEAHITIPGELDVSGMVPNGVPLVGIGHNASVGWSHTVSTSTRSARYRLNLEEGSPTTYVVDGVEHEMETTTVTVDALNDDGELEEVEHTYYDTIFGYVSSPGSLSWTEEHAYTFNPATINLAGANTHFMYAKSESVRDMHEADKAAMGWQWINTVAADADGEAYYSMPNAVPYLTDSQLTTCDIGGGVLDGSTQDCAFVDDPDAVHEGTRPPRDMPYLFRDDYVQNSNNSHWQSNPNKPLVGFSPLFGSESAEQGRRTRHGITLIEERLDGSDGLPGNGFTFDQFTDKTFDGTNWLGRLWRDDLVEQCEKLAVNDEDAPEQIAEACHVLAAWGTTDELDDPGAVLFRRFAEESGTGSDRFTVPFDVADPVGTPRGLVDDDATRDALYAAIGSLVDAGIALDATLRDYQYRVVAGGERIPVPGGPGIYKALFLSDFLGADGWQAGGGTGFVMWVEFTPDGPVGEQILIQGQSSNPASPHYSDQTQLIADGGVKEILFTEEAILSDPELEITKLRSSNRTPAVDDTAVTAEEARPADITLDASDPDGDDLQYSVSARPSNGAVTGDGPQFRYVSEIGFDGTDEFVVDVCDPHDACASATVSVDVNGFTPPGTPPDATGELKLDQSTAAAGDTVHVSGSGFEPGEAVFVVLYSDPVELSAVLADDEGNLSADVIIPAGAVAGEHQLVAFGSSEILLADITVTIQTEPPGTEPDDKKPGDDQTSDDKLAQTGSSTGTLVIFGALLVITGAAAAAYGWRRRSRSSWS